LNKLFIFFLNSFLNLLLILFSLIFKFHLLFTKYGKGTWQKWFQISMVIQVVHKHVLRSC